MSKQDSSREHLAIETQAGFVEGVIHAHTPLPGQVPPNDLPQPVPPGSPAEIPEPIQDPTRPENIPPVEDPPETPTPITV